MVCLSSSGAWGHLSLLSPHPLGCLLVVWLSLCWDTDGSALYMGDGVNYSYFYSQSIKMRFAGGPQPCKLS